MPLTVVSWPALQMTANNNSDRMVEFSKPQETHPTRTFKQRLHENQINMQDPQYQPINRNLSNVSRVLLLHGYNNIFHNLYQSGANSKTFTLI